MRRLLVAILNSHRAAQAKERLALGSAYAVGDLVFAMPDGNPIRPWNGAAFANYTTYATRTLRFR